VYSAARRPERSAPSQEGKTIFVGKDNICERLLIHWDHEKPSDRHAELVRELRPLCQPAPCCQLSTFTLPEQ